MEPSKTFDGKMLGTAFSQLGQAFTNPTIHKLAGDASSRQYFRLTDNQKKSYVLQVSESFEDPSTHPFLVARALLEAAGISVPKLYGTVPSSGWILLQDLGDATLQQHPSPASYTEAIDLIVKWAEKLSPDSSVLDEKLRRQAPHFRWAFDFEKLQAEMAFTEEHLFKKFLKREGDNFLSLVQANSAYLDKCPRVFCHRDFHSRNLMVKNGKLWVIDFQDARMGPLSYDLVSLLWDPYVDFKAGWRDKLLSHWKVATAKLVKKLTDAGSDHDFEIEMERMKIQRLLKAAGSYASFYNRQGRKDYLPYIAPALRDTRGALEALVKRHAATSQDEKLLTLLASIENEISDIIKDT